MMEDLEQPSILTGKRGEMKDLFLDAENGVSTSFFGLAEEGVLQPDRAAARGRPGRGARRPRELVGAEERVVKS